MTRNFLAVTAMALSLASTSALAQTTGAGTDGTAGMAGADQAGMPAEWQGAIGDAFYSDAELGTLRDAEEMRSNWDGLSEDDQAVVRDYCADFDTAGDQTAPDAEAGADTGAAADTATTQEGGTGQVEEPGSPGTQSGVATTDAHQASIAQVCELIDEDAS